VAARSISPTNASDGAARGPRRRRRASAGAGERTLHDIEVEAAGSTWRGNPLDQRLERVAQRAIAVMPAIRAPPLSVQ
jgi:hypothetical protein